MQENRMIDLLPGSIRMIVKKEVPDIGNLQEIRLRAGKPLIFMCRGEEVVPEAGKGARGRYIVTKEEIDEAYEKNTGVLIADEFRDRNLDYAATPAVLCKNHGPFTWGGDAH